MATRKERVVVMGQRKTGISGDGRLKLALGRCPIPIVPEERVGQRVVRLGVGWVRAEPRWPPISVRSNAVGGCSPDCGIGNDLRKPQVAQPMPVLVRLYWKEHAMADTQVFDDAVRIDPTPRAQLLFKHLAAAWHAERGATSSITEMSMCRSY
jgi:hypothetical protein